MLSLWILFFAAVAGANDIFIDRNSCSYIFLSLSNPKMIVERSLDKNPDSLKAKTESYYELFGDSFKEFLHSLGLKNVWLDSGAGMQFAIQRYHELRRSLGLPSAHTIGLMYEAPSKAEFDAVRKFLLDFPHSELSGRYLEEVPSSELGKLDLITDFFGPLAYTQNLSYVFEKYFNALKTGGRLYIKNPPVLFYINGHYFNGLAVYLRMIKGIQAKGIERGPLGYVDSFEIIRTEEDIELPKLELIKYKIGNPPIVDYRILNSVLQNP